MLTINKIVVSSKWTEDERAKVAQLIQTEISRLEVTEEEMRKTIPSKAPCFVEIKAKKDSLAELKHFVLRAVGKFLEMNRGHLSDFIEQ